MTTSQRARALVWLTVAGAIALRIFYFTPAKIAPMREAIARHPAVSIAGLLWLVASLYWEFEARNSATNRKAEASTSRGLHVVLVNSALLLLFVPVPGFTGRYLRAWPSIAAAGLAIETGGFALAIWARRHLGRNWSGRITIKIEHQLVRSGPYRFVRHPIYAAFLAMYGGTAIVSGEWHALAGFALAVLAYWRKIRMEEQNLASHFGEEWSDYCRATGSLLPRALGKLRYEVIRAQAARRTRGHRMAS